MMKRLGRRDDGAMLILVLIIVSAIGLVRNRSVPGRHERPSDP